MKSWTPPTDEMLDRVLTSVKKETDRQYFFSRLKNPLWIEPLRERGYFNTPPGMKKLPDGYVQYPHWSELAYLATIAREAAEQVVEIVRSLPKTDNPRVYEDILAIALKLEGKNSAKLLEKLIEYTELNNPFLAYRYPELLQHWIVQGNIDEALDLAKRLIPFQEDTETREKQKRRKKEPAVYSTTLDPAPRFDQWKYQEILEKGVRPLADIQPYQTACILIDAVVGMIQLRSRPEDHGSKRDEDYSEIWCPRLDKSDREYLDMKELLVHTLTYACLQVYNKAPESINTLDQTLRNQRWKVFKRLRQHLYSSNPNDQTLPWIREQILTHEDYSRWEHHYEFQLMIRKACEHFGTQLLTVGEREEVLGAILSGPLKEDYHSWAGERYSDKAFRQYQRNFHRMQLHPFAALLSGEIQSYFSELNSEAQEAVTDDSYRPYTIGETDWISHKSPKSAEDLEGLTDEEMLSYLNDWDQVQHDKDNWLVEINVSALASVFQSVFKEKIVPDSERLSFWMENRDRIERPIYVASMVKVMQELVKEKNFDRLDQWTEFCGWILTHPDSERMENQTEPRDESRDYPDWGSSRRAVVDFVDACVDKETETPITTRDGLAGLLQVGCNQFDWRLDRDRPVLLNRNDPITEAINNTRGRALESLISFGFWIRRYLPEDPVTEVTGILSKRLAVDADYPLTQPEYALLGMQFNNLFVLNQEWITNQRSTLFPQGNMLVWRDAFSSYIRFNRPYKGIFEILREEFEYALENLGELVTTEDDDREFIDRMGQFLFSYYLWEVYPLIGEGSLLERFYDKTNDDRKRWAHLFDHVGRSLNSSGINLDITLADRATAYFDWRFNVAELTELQGFTFWLKAECLDAEWRLQSYSKILDLGPGKSMGLSLEVKALNELLPDHVPQVVECFSKITDNMDQSTQVYISADEAKPILKAGLNAKDAQVRENAERARENLLRLGRFDYLDIEG